MTIHLGIYDGPTGPLLLDATARGAKGIKASTNQHGYERLLATVPATLPDIWRIYDYGAPPYARLRANGYTIWEGRVADPELLSEQEDGIVIQAVGAWDTFGDIPYTALWSHSGTADWRPLRGTETTATATPGHWQTDVNNRLYITLVKNSVIPNNTAGALAYRLPDGSSRVATRVSFSYTTVLPPSFALRITWYSAAPGNASWTAIAGATVITGSGTGSVTQSLTGSPVAVDVRIANLSGSSYTVAAETDAFYAICTNVRVTSQATPITVANIAADMVATIAALNPSQLDASTAQIGFGLSLPDITDAIYEDADMRRILDNLTARGDSSGGLLECAIWDDRRLVLQARGASARAWAADAASIRLRRPLETVANSTYGVYQEADGYALRTAVANDTQSIARLGMTRRAAIEANTTSSAEATRRRDLALTDRAQPQPAAMYSIPALFSLSGAPWPSYMLRAGDTLNVRGIPSGFGATVDRLRTVRIKRTDYDADSDTIAFEPETPIQSLEVMLAQRG